MEDEEQYAEWEKRIIERVAERVLEKVESDFYEKVGRTGVKIILWVAGSALGGIVLWEVGKGAMKISLF